MEKISWLDKVPNEEVLRKVDEDRQILNCKGTIDGLDVLRHKTEFFMELLKAE